MTTRRERAERHGTPEPRPPGFPSSVRWILLTLFSICRVAPASAQFIRHPVQNDSLVLRNGDVLTGEFRQLSRGLVTLKTDAASTISVKWPRVLTAVTDKQFEITTHDGIRRFGSMGRGDRLGWVKIRTLSDTTEVPITSVVDMVRLKGSFFRRLDGSVDLGANYSQQNNKVDANLSARFRYIRAGTRAGLKLNGSLSRQDSTANITRGDATVSYVSELQNRWIFGIIVSGEENSQLSLDLRLTAGAGPGRYWVHTNGLVLSSLLEVAVTKENFTGEDVRSTLPVSLVTDIEVFNWAGLSTDLSGMLNIERVASDAGRWRFVFDAKLRKELVSNLYLSVGVNEQYDSRPPAAGANKNDFYVSTSLGWTFF